MSSELLGAVAGYYEDRLQRYGATPRGVDWNSAESQWMRFAQLIKVVPPARPFSICDLGCGYGAMVEYLDAAKLDYSYIGVDISADMVRKATELHAGQPRARFELGLDRLPPLDYCVASGIFNVRLNTPDEAWHRHVLETLARMDSIGKRGFAFNCLTRYSEARRMHGYLFYADPCELFDHCKRQFSRNVALLHDYRLYEFTLVVRKDA